MTEDNQKITSKNSGKITNIAAYQFVRLENVEALREQLYADLADLAVWGTILLAEEGINLMLAAQGDILEKVRVILSGYSVFSTMIYKETYSSTIPFSKFRIKIKTEIVPMSIPEIDPVCYTGPTISAQELKQWLDEGRDFTLLDTRNDYEIEIGTFEKAIHFNIHQFREFDGSLKNATDEMKQKPLVMFCTGGIRCEKASPLLLQRGFKEVYQLEGGIIKYFQEVGGAHFRGNCFVFDYRTAITPACEETGLTQCERCQQFVTAQEQALTNYRRGDYCIKCMPEAKSA